MNVSISSLEKKVDAVLALCEQLRGENRALREMNQTLSATIDSTSNRLEALLERLPEEE